MSYDLHAAASALGLSPSPFTDKLLDLAVEAGVVETDDLDWKLELPPLSGISQTDVPKDIAAMANSGGGMIVYGVEENEKAATGRRDTGEFTERHERAFRSAAVTAISPPIFGLIVHRVGTERRAVAVEVPPSADGPHLIYKNYLFGAPVRNDADTAWMKERQIEAMYRARFDERRRASDALDSLYEESGNGRDVRERAWFVAVAHPRLPAVASRPDRDRARRIFGRVEAITFSHSSSNGVHPFGQVERSNPRPGLRRWIAVNTAIGERERWKEAGAEVHHDGSVMLAAAVGGHRINDGYRDGWQVESCGIECCVAGFAALLLATAEAYSLDEYEVRVGIEWEGAQALQILTVDGSGQTYDGVSTPLRQYVPVRSALNVATSDDDYHRVFRLAEDCVNQGGITHLHAVSVPAVEEPEL